MPVPVMMNLELTTSCPLRCPQCYLHLNTGEDMDRDTALYWVREAARSGVKMIALSGGETLAYPYLDDVLSECGRLELTTAVALSGAYATKERLSALIETGVSEIYVSLNGSTEEINARSRDGYSLAINTLSLLKELSFKKIFINFVLQKSNAADLPEMLRLSERLGVKELVVLAFKPDSAHEFLNFPTKEQLLDTASYIRSYKGTVPVSVESCFSQLRALIGRSSRRNFNVGIRYGCGAGRDGVSVNVKGKLTPCRHLDIPEETGSLTDYWNNSPVLKELRSIEDHREAPCKGCVYEKSCLPCSAVGWKLHGKILGGTEECPVKDIKG